MNIKIKNSELHFRKDENLNKIFFHALYSYILSELKTII